MIKIVPFITEYLELRFKDDDKLYLVDYHRLITEKFLSQIYELLNEEKSKNYHSIFNSILNPLWLY